MHNVSFQNVFVINHYNLLLITKQDNIPIYFSSFLRDVDQLLGHSSRGRKGCLKSKRLNEIAGDFAAPASIVFEQLLIDLNLLSTVHVPLSSGLDLELLSVINRRF